MKNSRVVYTVIFNNYDELKEIKNISENIDYICFTNDPLLKSHTWKIIFVDVQSDYSLVNRKYKMFPFCYLDYSESIYLDGNISINGDLNHIFDFYLQGYDISVSPHPFRNCIYDEAKACINSKKVPPEIVEQQLDYYRQEKFPEQFGLFENNIIVRRHSDMVKKLMSDWWCQFKLFSKRDQLSFCYVLWKNNIYCNRLECGPRYSNKYFDFHLHSHEKSLSLMKKIILISGVKQKQNFFYFALNNIYKYICRKYK